jgi:hypothetical protein
VDLDVKLVVDINRDFCGQGVIGPGAVEGKFLIGLDLLIKDYSVVLLLDYFNLGYLVS